ncbi:Zn(2)-C6 fungal-type domain-containing protein [Fusarium falciforme]|uniref:Zn(2)-C6 fungal-type domain-containing protein n=1 Tax=Fusarium falciforme TaxID=195108 RepID=UPI0023008FAB|nr:Zn(2)-C6 fungal-type domain-containing protein [Fusarium falciforme]WAO90249.1 Zn(2)-C6 fungal-type domain-containing protein [Fusarium falciforme]
METGMERRPASAAAPQGGQRQPKTRTRITTACTRCQKRKIRCDALSPACSACQRAGVPCVGGGTSREFPRSYVNDLEARIRWLESIVQEHAPDVDLSAGPGRSPSTEGGNPSRDLQATQQGQQAGDNQSPGKITDQLGLISLTSGTDLRFLGPSSGLFFTKFVLAGLGKRLHVDKESAPDTATDNLAIPSDLLVPQPKELPSDHKHARWLSQAYFNVVHLQFPFLHEPTYWEIIDKIYNDVEVGAVAEFQVFMVLAIGATILSRRTRVALSPEGYYASAMNLVAGAINMPSVSCVQCTLLLQMYALNNPTSGLSLWTLHHHGLAMVIELGLHRNVPESNFTPFEREIRRRIFWSTYTIDRLLSTLMGRPMGVVDEQCDLNYPADVDDSQLKTEHPKPRQGDEPLTNMSSAIHLFKLARLNSEIKCVLYCADREYPPYTQPVITDTESWRVDFLNRLRQWRQDIPRHGEASPRHYLNLWCEIKYHEVLMLILRPNPRFHNPDKATIRECFSSAMACSELYHRLYMTNMLHYGWMSVHSLFLSVMVMFYCVCTPRGIADEADFDALMRALKVSSDILSAMGEYWPEAKKSRDVLDRVSTATIRRFTQNLKAARNNSIAPDSQASVNPSSLLGSNHAADWTSIDLSSNSVPSLQFEDTNVVDVPFGLGYEALEQSFTSADILSHFFGSGTDVMMGGAYDFEHARDRDTDESFGERLQDFGHPY